VRRWGPSAAALAAVCAATLAACASPAAAPSTSSAPGAAATATPGATEVTASPSSADPADADWKTFTTSVGQLTFDYPAEWSIKDPAGEPASGGVFVEVTNEAGKSMATLRTNMVTGAECPVKQPYSVYESEPLPALEQNGSVPRFVFEARSDTSQTDPLKVDAFAYGITSAPEPTGADACPMFHFFAWPPSGAMFGGVYNPFDTTPGNPMHADTPEVYATTSEFQDIRKMITSLRPAGA
jgi:hypothetical protein